MDDDQPHVCCESCLQDIEAGYCEILDYNECCCRGPKRKDRP